MPLRCSLALLVLGTAALHAQTADRPTGFPAGCGPAEVQVMLLGTYHFANPGRDVIKQDIDDVLQPKRQAELEDLLAFASRHGYSTMPSIRSTMTRSST